MQRLSEGQTAADNTMSILFRVLGGPAGNFVSVPLERFEVPDVPNLLSWVGSRTVKFYAAAGQEVRAALYATNSLTVHPNGNLTISGYLVDVP